MSEVLVLVLVLVSQVLVLVLACPVLINISALTLMASDVNKDWTCKDKNQAYKDQDKD